MSIVKKYALELSMEARFNKHQVFYEYNGETHSLKKGHNHLNLTMTKVEQLFTIKFIGFDWRDPSQSVRLRLFAGEKELIMDSLVFFTREGNQGMPKEELINYKEIQHNGTLTIKFYHSYVRSIICDGMPLVKDRADLICGHDPHYLHKDPTSDLPNYSDIVLLGSCHLNDSKQQWTPSFSTILAAQYPKKIITTFAPGGINDWAVLHNALWMLHHRKMKNLLLTLNIGGTFVAKATFLDNTIYVPALGRFPEWVPNYKKQRKAQKYMIERKPLWHKLLRQKLKKVMEICESKGINLQLINYTAKDMWFRQFDHVDFYHKHLDRACLFNKDRTLLIDCYKKMLNDLKII